MNINDYVNKRTHNDFFKNKIIMYHFLMNDRNLQFLDTKNAFVI